MAEDFAESRTETPTQRRREDAREQGQIPYSSELAGGLLLLAGMVALLMAGPSLAGGMKDLVRVEIDRLRFKDLPQEGAAALLTDFLMRGGDLVGFIMGWLFAVGAGVGLAQAGVRVVPSLLAFRFEKLWPSDFIGKLISIPAVVRGIVAVVKVAAIAALAIYMLRGREPLITSLATGNLEFAVTQGWDLVMRICLTIAGALVVIGAADYGYQRFRFERSLMMSRQELKEELKREEGDPQVKARIRALQRAAAKKRMFRELPKATVVLTNPTHLAVALRYQRGEMDAPHVVAKGAGYVAKSIVEIARKHGITVLERKPLAQALYHAVEVDQDIPIALYKAVAEMLAYLYQLRGAPLEEKAAAVAARRAGASSKTRRVVRHRAAVVPGASGSGEMQGVRGVV